MCIFVYTHICNMCVCIHIHSANHHSSAIVVFVSAIGYYYEHYWYHYSYHFYRNTIILTICLSIVTVICTMSYVV